MTFLRKPSSFELPLRDLPVSMAAQQEAPKAEQHDHFSTLPSPTVAELDKQWEKTTDDEVKLPSPHHYLFSSPLILLFLNPLIFTIMKHYDFSLLVSETSSHILSRLASKS